MNMSLEFLQYVDCADTSDVRALVRARARVAHWIVEQSHPGTNRELVESLEGVAEAVHVISVAGGEDDRVNGFMVHDGVVIDEPHVPRHVLRHSIDAAGTELIVRPYRVPGRHESDSAIDSIQVLAVPSLAVVRGDQTLTHIELPSAGMIDSYETGDDSDEDLESIRVSAMRGRRIVREYPFLREGRERKIRTDTRSPERTYARHLSRLASILLWVTPNADEITQRRREVEAALGRGA